MKKAEEETRTCLLCKHCFPCAFIDSPKKKECGVEVLKLTKI